MTTIYGVNSSDLYKKLELIIVIIFSLFFIDYYYSMELILVQGLTGFNIDLTWICEIPFTHEKRNSRLKSVRHAHVVVNRGVKRILAPKHDNIGNRVVYRCGIDKSKRACANESNLTFI